MRGQVNKWANPRILVVAPGHGGRGGIDSVVRLYQSTPMWEAMGCFMLSTYDDRSTLRKICAALRGYMLAPAAIYGSEIVHVHLAGEISLLRKMPVMLLAKLLQRRLIVHVHACSEESLFEKTPRWAWTYCLNAADCVIALSPLWELAIRKHAPRAQVTVVPNPVRSFRPVARERNSVPRILYVGKLEGRKGYNTLMDAAAIVLREFPQAQFWFAGHGELEAAQAYAGRCGVLTAVRLLGWISGDELEKVYDDADIFCLPSHNEGVPMSMLEAMSHSLPVVCTPVGGIPDVIEDRSNGLLVRPGNPESIADGILHLLRDPEFAALIAQSGKEKVEEMCSLAAIEAQMTSIYLGLAQPTRCAPVEIRHDA